MSNKKFTTYIAGSPKQIISSEDKRSFREFLAWLQEVSHLTPWTVHPVWWDPRPDQERPYEVELEIMHSVDLVIAIYPTDEGALRREVGVIERLIIGRPLIAAVHKRVEPSIFLKSMYNRYTNRPFVRFEKFSDLCKVVEQRLSELSVY